MAKKITKATLAELAREMSILSEQDQYSYYGGGNGSSFDPYTYEEYQNLVFSGSWHGGYVLGSVDTYTADGSGNWIRNAGSVAVYLPAEAGRDDYMGGGVSGNYSWADPSGNIINGSYHEWIRNNYPNGITYTSPDNSPNDGMYPNIPAPSDWGGSGSGENPNTTIPEGITLGRGMTDYLGEHVRLALANLYNNKGIMRNIIDKFGKSRNFVSTSVSVDAIRSHGLTSYNTVLNQNNGKFEIGIKIDIQFLQIATSSDIGSLAVTAVLAHELIHAELFRINYIGTKDPLLTDKFDKSVAPTLSEYLNLQNQGKIAQAHHEYIATYYVKLIEQELRKSIPNRTDFEYEAMSWIGLLETERFQMLENKVKIKEFLDDYGL